MAYRDKRSVMDALLDTEPTVIVWRKNNHGVLVHVSVHDPFPDGPVHNSVKTHCLRDHPFDEENTYVKADGSRQCRTCKRGYSDMKGEVA
jgi:hypothetical protein